MPISLTSRERAHLKARAHALEPHVSVGHGGLTKAVVAEIDRALAEHELIKVKILGDDRELRKRIGDDIGAAPTQRSCSASAKSLVLWRPKPEEPDSGVVHSPPNRVDSPRERPPERTRSHRPDARVRASLLESVMEITKRHVADITVLDLKGKLTIGDGAELLRDNVTSIVFQGNRKVMLNLAGVPYMDSGGLGELVRCSMIVQREKGTVKLINLTRRSPIC